MIVNDVETLVFLPGLLSDARVWRPVAGRLPVDNPVHHADLTRDASIAGMAARVLEEVAGEMIVAGHSMGGRVALEMARQAPDRVRGLVLADTGYGPVRAGEEVSRQAKIDLGHRDMAALADAWLPPMVDEGRHGDAALMGPLREMVLAAGPEVHERQIRALLGRPDAGSYLGALTCPMLLLVGETDAWSPVAQHEEIAALARDAVLRVIPAAGHFAPVERPEEVAREIGDWLRGRE